MEVLYQSCAGLDVHKKTVVACRMRGQGKRETRTFGTTTPELLELGDWLAEWEVTHVAMESTGDYWRPIYNLLEGQFELLVVNARHVKQVPGRKTDVKDAEWLADLLRHGLLKASYVPGREQRALRDLTRYRIKLVQQRAQLINRVQKVLEDANIKLASVAKNVLGVSGRSMLEALLAGESDGTVLAKLARGRLKAKEPALIQALTGHMQAHHRFLLSEQLDLFDFLSQQIEELDSQITQQMHEMDEKPTEVSEDGGASGSKPETDPGVESPLTHEESIALLDTIPGVNRATAEVMVAEMGLDMSRFPTAKHLASWAGIAPGNNESAGKRYSGKTGKGNRRLRTSLTQAAWAASHTKDTYFNAQYHRLAARRGKKRAIVAVGHSILVAAYHMLVRRQSYQELGHQYFDQRQQQSTARHLLRRLEKLGIEVTVQNSALTAA